MGAAPTQEKGEKRRDAIGEGYQGELPELGRCVLEDAEARLTHLAGPKRPQHYGRTSNLGERAVGEERRRPTVSPPLGTTGSVGHLVFGVVSRVSDRWGQQGFREFAHHQIRSLRERLQLDEPKVNMDEPSSHVPTRRRAASAA